MNLLLKSLLLILVASAESYAASPCEIQGRLTMLTSKSSDALSLIDIQLLEKDNFDEFSKKISKECQLQNEFALAQNRFFTTPNITKLKSIYPNTQPSPEFISKNRALRFINIEAYTKAHKNKRKYHPDISFRQVPVSEIYQPRNRAAGSYQASQIVWDSWENGTQYLDSYVMQLKNLSTPAISHISLKLSHERFYHLALMIDNKNHDPSPGFYRATQPNTKKTSLGWKLQIRYNHHKYYLNKDSCFGPNRQADPEKMKLCKNLKAHKDFEQVKIFMEKNTFLRQLGLLPETKETDSEGKSLNWIARFENGNYYHVHPEMVPHHMEKWLGFFNNYYSVIASNYTLPSQYPLMTPLEFISFMQKWLISIHPFEDGNGRTSRLWQEALAKSFNMPFAVSANLQNDMFSSIKAYYLQYVKSTQLYIDTINQCINFYESNMNNPESEYQCRILKTYNNKGSKIE